MLALNFDPINSKPLKNPSVFPPKSSLKLKLSSSYAPFSSNSVKPHESYKTNLQIASTKSKLHFIHSNPTSHITKASSSSSSLSSETLPTKTRKLALIFSLWYLQNIVFNIYNKKCLDIFPFPWLLASFQLFVSAIWMFFLWSSKLQPCPKITKPFLISLLVTSLFHTVGHISACVLFSKMALFFINVIRSSEPVVAVIFSSFLGQSYPFSIWVSVLPIVFGCYLATITEFSFNFHGLWGAVISNLGFVLRNIYSKKSLQRFKEVDGLNLYGCISIISFIYLFPVAVIVEGTQWVRGYHKAIATIGNCRTFYLWFSIAGVFYHLYNQTSYQALDEITPLTFSVGNAMIGVVVIVSTVLLFRNPVWPINALGIGVAILGTYLYSKAIAAQMAKKKKIEVADHPSFSFQTPILGFLLSFFKKIMGQILDKIQGKEWRQKQIRKITDKVFNHVSDQTGRVSLTFEELYITVLIVYNDINKYLPGPHFDPPPKDKVRTLMQECDINLDGELDHEEFVKFIKELTKDTFNSISQGLIISLVVAPTVAITTKRATEGVPGVGKVVQKLPVSIYASLVTLAVVALQSANQGLD